MKYTTEVIIDAPRSKVIELMDNPDNLKLWNTGLQSFETFEGKQGEVGAKSRLKYDTGSRKFEMIETITKKNLPEEFFGQYEMGGTLTEVRNYFYETEDGKTRYVTENEFKANNILMMVMMFFMRGAIRKQSDELANNFKKFAESKK